MYRYVYIYIPVNADTCSYVYNHMHIHTHTHAQVYAHHICIMQMCIHVPIYEYLSKLSMFVYKDIHTYKSIVMSIHPPPHTRFQQTQVASSRATRFRRQAQQRVLNVHTYNIWHERVARRHSLGCLYVRGVRARAVKMCSNALSVFSALVVRELWRR